MTEIDYSISMSWIVDGAGSPLVPPKVRGASYNSVLNEGAAVYRSLIEAMGPEKEVSTHRNRV